MRQATSVAESEQIHGQHGDADQHHVRTENHDDGGVQVVLELAYVGRRVQSVDLDLALLVRVHHHAQGSVAASRVSVPTIVDVRIVGLDLDKAAEELRHHGAILHQISQLHAQLEFRVFDTLNGK